MAWKWSKWVIWKWVQETFYSISFTAYFLLYFPLLLQIQLWGTTSYVHWRNTVKVNYKESAMAKGKYKVAEILNFDFYKKKKFYVEYKNSVSYFQVLSSVFLGVSQWIHFTTGFCISADGKNQKPWFWIQASLGPGGKGWAKRLNFLWKNESSDRGRKKFN